MKTEFIEDLIFEPISCLNLVTLNKTQLNLHINRRMIYLDEQTNLLKFYIEVDAKNTYLIVPVKYYEFLSSAQTQKVILDYYILRDSIGNQYNFLETAHFDKPNLEIVPTGQIENPLLITCTKLQDAYSKEYLINQDEKILMSRITKNNIEGVANVVIDGKRYRANVPCNVLLNHKNTTLSYRNLLVNNRRFITDINLINLERRDI